MASRNLMTAFMILISTAGILYIFMATFGTAMDGFYYTFTNLTPTLALPANGEVEADRTLTYWRLF